MFGKSIAKGMVVAALLAAAAGPARAQQGNAAADPLARIATYEFEQGVGPVVAIEELARHPGQKPKIEAAMIAVLANPQATQAGKQSACRLLRLVGTEKSVPALAGLLGDPKLSHMARWALQMMPYPAVDEAFAKALGELKGDLRIGLINSMGARKDARALAALAKLAGDRDSKTADAAITALGRIGGPEADAALARLTPGDPALESARDDARLISAEQMLKEGKTAEAGAICKSLFAESRPVMIRVAALRGIARSQKEAALPLLLKNMKGADAQLAAAACKYYNEIPGPAAAKALADALPGLEPRMQVIALATLTARGDRSAAPAAAGMLGVSNTDVKATAARALAVLGDAGQVRPLIAAAGADDAAGVAAREALGLIHGEGVGAAIIQAAGSGAPALRARMIDVLYARREPGALAVLFKAAQDPDSGVAAAAARALGTVAGEKDLPLLVEMLLASKTVEEREKLGGILLNVAGRVKDSEGATTLIVGKLGAADNAVKGNLLEALAKLGSPRSFEVISGQLTSTDLDLRKSALRVLAAWPNEKPAAALLAVARQDGDEVCRALALRGYVDVVGKAKSIGAAEQVKMLKDALALAKSSSDKSQVLRVLGNITDPAALALVEPCLKDNEMGTMAQYSYVKIASSLKDRNAAREALSKLIAMPNTDDAVKQSARGALEKIK